MSARDGHLDSAARSAADLGWAPPICLLGLALLWIALVLSLGSAVGGALGPRPPFRPMGHEAIRL